MYTRGRRTEAADLPMGEEWYRAQGIDVADSDRGGRVTYHGPGQLVGYPIMAIDDVPAFVARSRRAMVAALADEGIPAEARDAPSPASGRATRKIGSIGVHVSRGVTTHGLAVNVDNDLQPFQWIVPCGVESRADDLGAAGDRPRRPAALLPQAGRAPLRRGRSGAASASSPSSGCCSASAVRSRRRMSTRSRANPGGARVLDLGEVLPFGERKPAWFKVQAPGTPATASCAG